MTVPLGQEKAQVVYDLDPDIEKYVLDNSSNIIVGTGSSADVKSIATIARAGNLRILGPMPGAYEQEVFLPKGRYRSMCALDSRHIMLSGMMIVTDHETERVDQAAYLAVESRDPGERVSQYRNEDLGSKNRMEPWLGTHERAMHGTVD